jgi:hypothetical protein
MLAPDPARPLMSSEEYLSVLVSIVIGLGISHLLTGVGNLLVDRARVRFYWVWGAFVLLTFMAYVQLWWATFGLGGEGVLTNFFGFLFFMLPPIGLFLMTVLLLPDFEGEGTIDLRRHYFANHRWFFGIGALVPLLGGIRAVLLSGDPITELDRLFDVFFITLLLTGAVSRSPRVHAILAAISVAAFLAMIVTTSMTPG